MKDAKEILMNFLKRQQIIHMNENREISDKELSEHLEWLCRYFEAMNSLWAGRFIKKDFIETGEIFSDLLKWSKRAENVNNQTLEHFRRIVQENKT